MKYKAITIFIIFFLFCFNTSVALAETLTERLATYPNWHNKPTLEKRDGDIYYPEWMAGT